MSKNVTRREVLASVGVGGTLGLAGCGTTVDDLPRPEQLWGASIPSPADPTVGDESVFIAGDDGIHRFDAEGGEELWVSDLNPTGVGQYPLVQDDRVFAVGEGTLHRLDHETGDALWGRRISEEQSISVDVSKHAVCVTFGGTVRVLDPNTGELRWETPGYRVFPHGDAVWVATDSGSASQLLHVHDATTGQQRWSRTIRSADRLDLSFDDAGSVFVGHGVRADRVEGETESEYSISAYDREAGERRWRVDEGSTTVFGVEHVKDGSVFLSSANGPRAIDARTGQTVWNRETGLEAYDSVFAGGWIVFGEARPEGGGHRFRAFGVNDGTAQWATPWRGDGNIEHTAGSSESVYVDTTTDTRLDDVVACFDPESGERRWVLPEGLWEADGDTLYAAKRAENSLVAYF